MSNKKTNFLTIQMEKKAKTNASSSKMLLFFNFECPHCGTLNVYAKSIKKEVIICSHRGCKKMIIINNFQDIA